MLKDQSACLCPPLGGPIRNRRISPFIRVHRCSSVVDSISNCIETAGERVQGEVRARQPLIRPSLEHDCVGHLFRLGAAEKLFDQCQTKIHGGAGAARSDDVPVLHNLVPRECEGELFVH